MGADWLEEDGKGEGDGHLHYTDELYHLSLTSSITNFMRIKYSKLYANKKLTNCTLRVVLCPFLMCLGISAFGFLGNGAHYLITVVVVVVVM